jgi:hypothetical protein
MSAIYHFKINGLGITDKEFNALPFGRQIELSKKIREFKLSAKTNHFNAKRISFQKGLKKFLKLYNVSEYFTVNRDGENYKSDSNVIWYKN